VLLILDRVFDSTLLWGIAGMGIGVEIGLFIALVVARRAEDN